MTKEEMLTQAQRLRHSGDRLFRLIDCDAPPIIIERERLLGLEILGGMAPDADLTERARATFTDEKGGG